MVQTFRSGTYAAETLSEPTVLYRAYSDPKYKFGQYWTRVEPSGPLQSMIDSALDPSFHNRATEVVKIRVPNGETIYEGVVSPYGSLVGGGSQVYLSKQPDPSWVIP